MLVRSADDLRRRDSRAPIIFFRPFESIPGDTFPRSFERRLRRAMRRIGPLLAVASPWDELPPRGAARYYVPDTEWQQRVMHLLSECQLVILHCATSPGLIWELTTIVRRLPPEKVVLSLPFKEKGVKRLEAWRYEEFRETTQSLFPLPLPASVPSSTRFIYFDSEWRPSSFGVSWKHRPLSGTRAVFDTAATRSEAVKRLFKEFRTFLPHLMWRPGPILAWPWAIFVVLVSRTPWHIIAVAQGGSLIGLLKAEQQVIMTEPLVAFPLALMAASMLLGLIRSVWESRAAQRMTGARSNVS